jgi:hypothetical protein
VAPCSKRRVSRQLALTDMHRFPIGPRTMRESREPQPNLAHLWRRRLKRHQTQTEPAAEAPEWRTLSPSAELLVDPERRTRCAVRHTQVPGADRFLWSVTLLRHLHTIAVGRTGEREEARQLAEAALATYAADWREVPVWQGDDAKPGTAVARCADRPSIQADNPDPVRPTAACGGGRQQRRRTTPQAPRLRSRRSLDADRERSAGGTPERRHTPNRHR